MSNDRASAAADGRGCTGAGDALAATVCRVLAADGRSDSAPDLDRLRPGSPMILLAYAYLAEQLAVLHEQTSPALAGDSPEGVHQMRIATRRVRAALQAFEPILPAENARSLRSGFKSLTQALGRVRDLDVYRQRLGDEVASFDAPTAAALAPYLADLQHEYLDAREALARLLQGPRYRTLVDELAAFLEGSPSAAALRRWCSFRICDGAADYVLIALRRVRKRGRRLGREAPPEALHELRIRAKRLRYLMEIFSTVYGKALARQIKPIRRLQDTLGLHQDACVAADRLWAYTDRLPPAGDAEQLHALRKLVERQQEIATMARQQFRTDWRRFERRLQSRELRKLLRAK